MIWDIDLIFGMRVYNDELQINLDIHLLFLALQKGETIASLLNIHGGDIRVVPTHLFFLLLFLIKCIWHKPFSFQIFLNILKISLRNLENYYLSINDYLWFLDLF
jgi:hypothetical protein